MIMVESGQGPFDDVVKRRDFCLTKGSSWNFVPS